MNKKLFLAQPRGFCAGVHRAIATVERALALFGQPIYVRHEIVHNTHVVDSLKQKGAIFIEELDDVPNGSTLIFSAHGVSKAIESEAKERGFRIFDATCPLVTKVHMEVSMMRQEDREIIVIGHSGHPEVEGTMGQSDTGMYLVESVEDIPELDVNNPDRLAYVSQTTLSVADTTDVIAALKAHFPAIIEPPKADICYATTNRQNAVKQLAEIATLIIVVGSPSSSNSNRLREVAERKGVTAYMVDNASEIDPQWLEGHTAIGVTAGASAPEILVQEVIEMLQKHGVTAIEELEGITENLSFPVPRGLGRR
ncbi:4-hydroxy-3-methylbut-2-enyl diphosphate reductase [Oxalobacter vibrioformis]|uniref:4-hydroxy-3-methylbut-2-enyl diphosphate reductase n=1 Tax=Oxalobacter vibrioformis TaxID=933080 RepID=A0A9E9P3T1_9BURK|nr:4-hydroxy-3-methylbut-2-enyl diphosphate reductase [Oxalobacter vibrioformis]WAW10575.1 4-hydroxy-3-methylbut-2-enyl diphosphate reductase [Oxalobacter vibrioformis]